MIRWRFTILNNKTSIATVIEEPVGWDKNKYDIKRNLDWHGIFFNNQGQDFEYHGDGERVLKSAYDIDGIQADCSLIVEENCGKGFELLDTSKFNFNDYDHIDENTCFVKCPLESTGEVMDIRNRVDQKVNLETDKAFDETTTLATYGKLPFSLTLPSKGIFIQDYFKNDNDFETPVQGVPENNNPGSPPFNNSEYGMIEVGFDNNVSSEIGNASSLTQSIYRCVLTSAGSLGCASFDRFELTPLYPTVQYISPLDASPWVNFQEGTRNYNAIDNPCGLELIIQGEITDVQCGIMNMYFVLAILPKGRIGNVESDYIFHTISGVGGATYGGNFSINIGIFDNNFILNKGDRIYAFFPIYHFRSEAAIASGVPAWKMKFNTGNYFKLNNLSHTPATPSKVFAINEAISRVTEVITNDKVRAFSEYFGRTDSEPYSHDDDGCGSLEVITDGLRIRRQENKIVGKTNFFSVSLKDLFEGLNPIHHIGMGLETDPNRSGFNRLRVEPWYHFYNDSVLMYCTGVNKISRKVFQKEIYSTFRFGYVKWEAEEYNGLDEFLTKRTYRTSLKEIINELTKLSPFVASGYALEVTRRIGNESSQDWRYDKETFIICVTRVRKIHVKFFAATNKMVFDIDTDGSEFLGPTTITISGSVSNNGTRNIFVVSILSIPGQATQVEIGFSGGTTVDEESYDVTFDIVSPSGLFVELGNVINPANIIDPRTLYNYRISPIRNAMRWMSKVLESYRKFDNDAKIIFTDGEGNYFAEGEMESLICKIENTTLVENMTIDKNIFVDEDQVKPFMRPERIVYEYPMNSCDYKNIKTNPGGLIYFDNGCECGYGYIDTIIYRPDEGLGNFNLIPAITDLPIPAIRPTLGHAPFISEEGLNLITEEDQALVTE